MLGELKAGLLRRLQDLELAEPPHRDCGTFARLLEDIEKLDEPRFDSKLKSEARGAPQAAPERPPAEVPAAAYLIMPADWELYRR